ncbi:MAG: recombination mediator RecR [Pseudomonadota bacterium]
MSGSGSDAPRRNDDRALERLIDTMAKLPGLGPRSARRAVLAMLKKRERLLQPMSDAMVDVIASVQTCVRCGNLGTGPLCDICADPTRDPRRLCVVPDVSDLWAIERSGAFDGEYHVLGGLLSALDGVTPETLRLTDLVRRAAGEADVAGYDKGSVAAEEVILALPASIDGQTTAHVIQDYLQPLGVRVTVLGRGVPVGGDLDYLDDGTLSAALSQRRPL